MNQALLSDGTICAIATAQGEGGIGIVRISGKDATSIVAPLYRGTCAWETFESHTAYYGEVLDPQNGSVIDEALFLLMKAPRSYTGEDVIEIQAHGNPFLLEKIVAALLTQGARLATPGEFTRRAFLSGRIDLAQAEAVMEVIAAKSDTQHQWALSQLKGTLSLKLSSLKERLLSIIAQIEAGIDFSEEELPLSSNKVIHEQITILLDELQAMLADYTLGRQIREGFTVVIVGRPNVGKSSLMNYFLQTDRAIVTPIAGTTRDLLQEPVNIDGILIKLVDTAGYHETNHPIEQEGMRRAAGARKDADLVLWMLDASQSLTAEDRQLAAELQGARMLLLLNKVDLPRYIDDKIIDEMNLGKKFIPMSVKTGKGLGELKRLIRGKLLKYPEKEAPLLALLRHKNALSTAEARLSSAATSILEGLSWEFPAIDLREGLDALSQITGETTLDEILDRIFGDFCIGK